MLICPNCGTANTDDSKFCEGCGTKLEGVARQAPGGSEEINAQPAAEPENAPNMEPDGGPAAEPTVEPGAEPAEEQTEPAEEQTEPAMGPSLSNGSRNTPTRGTTRIWARVLNKTCPRALTRILPRTWLPAGHPERKCPDCSLPSSWRRLAWCC